MAFTACVEIDPDNGNNNNGKDTTDVNPVSNSIVVGICPSGMSTSTKGYYKRCINDAGGVMLVCEEYCWTEAAAKSFINKVDALISPGSTANDADGTGLWPYKRSKSENYLIAAALDAGKPVLGICYGHQRLNAVMGGANAAVSVLAPDSQIPHKYVVDGSNVGVSSEIHKITIDPTSKLYELIGDTEVMVNSSHDYAVKTPSKRLKIVAVAEDGIVEGIEGISEPVMGVQFHPEFLYGKLGIERFRHIFDELVMNAKKIKESKK